MNLVQVVPPLLEARQEFLLAGCRGVVSSIEAVKKAVVDPSTGINTPRQLVCEIVGRLKSIPVFVVHLRGVFDEFVKFLLDERREVEMVPINQLGLVVSDRDVLACCHHILHKVHK